MNVERRGTPSWVGVTGLCAGLTGLMVMAGLLWAASPDVLYVGQFSRAVAGGAYPDAWEPLTFDKIERHTSYALVDDDGAVALRAESKNSSSGLTREVMIDPAMYPVVEWRWKVENVLQRGDVTRREGDDYPARLYITFAYDSSKVGFFERATYETARLLHGRYPPLAAINYIWESNSPVGTMAPNPFTDQVMMFVVESGREHVGRWRTESRNMYEDYKAAFGEDPTMISGVAVMTDTDNTHESAVAWFGDIVFKASSD